MPNKAPITLVEKLNLLIEAATALRDKLLWECKELLTPPEPIRILVYDEEMEE